MAKLTPITNRDKKKAKHQICAKMPKVGKGVLVKKKLEEDVFSRCFILAVSLHDAHLS